jgi:uncharacterized protein YfcZ (UPF0381/DUF406 family)
MASVKEINGTYDSKAISKLTFPIAWSGAPDQEYEAALAQLVSDAREALSEPGAVSVEIAEGEIKGVVFAQ